MGKDIVDKLTEAAIETQRLLGDLHSAMKEMKHTIKEAKEERLRIEQAVREVTKQQIDDAVSQGLAEYEAALNIAIANADKRMQERFDKLADIMLGEDKHSKRKGEPSLTDIARAQRSLHAE